MHRLKQIFWGILVIPVLLWLIAEPAALQSATFFSLRKLMVQLTGIVTISSMSAAMVLALRLHRPEAWLGGLDKMYRLHKWLGISVLVTATLHWLWAGGTKLAMDWGWLEQSVRGFGHNRGWAAHSGCNEGAGFGNDFATLFSIRHCLAEEAGKWIFCVTVVLIALALIRRFPYHLFYKTHRLLAVCYLVLVFHTVILLKHSYWLSPVGGLVAVLLVFGIWAAIVVLLRKVGAKRQVQGKITSLHYFPGVKALEIETEVTGWPGHKPGQFLFATTDAAEGAHPYTIASGWQAENSRITFITKALGDHTSQLHEKLQPGQPVRIEGPYGCFTFSDTCRRQIWVGGGIGITPFIARMKQLALSGEKQTRPENQQYDLFHSTADIDEKALNKLAEDARSSNVRLHVLIDARDGYLTGERIRAEIPEWREASIWFCGPAGFGEVLKKDFAAHGFPAEQHFHQELFLMR
ncbi:ferric reductase-like transmembrane domain-containing protein [Nitrosomonas sp.]|uniref:ferredoxin reductase family protein n=1 Tax=Nitrosomonas sp. TaxID=42353 RepID=UPI0025F201B9|nr:ferric reductase-like transmembrane domain-containing protein [Nitrosomonas sp.]MCC6916846.1 ferric reductase-like transmembrane domain-containing protein [Nitrosomonas sp.]